jgi:Family of unknown function (DUF5317)
MILFVSVIVLAVLLGFAFRGSLRGFERLRLRWWGLVIVGLGLQFVPLTNGPAGTDLLARVAVLSCSYSLLVVFALLNLRVAGMPLVLVGLVLNATVIIANGGMPVAREALVRSDQGDVLQLLIDEGAAKHHLLTEDDVLTPLADVIPIPSPIAQVVSVGDVFVYAGLVWLIIATMLGRIPMAPQQERGSYRGKHRRGEAAGSAQASIPPPPPATTTSATAP